MRLRPIPIELSPKGMQGRENTGCHPFFTGKGLSSSARFLLFAASGLSLS